jgi:NAD kinase
MKKNNQYRFVLVSRKTRLQELVERFNTWPQAKFYLEHNQVDGQDYFDENAQYQQCLVEAEQALKALGRFQLLERSFLPNYQFSPDDIVVVIGQDGLVANTLKYLNGQPVIAINPDPKRWDGRLLPFEMGQLDSVVKRVMTDSMADKTITFAEASTNDGQRMLAVNDLFIGPQSHTSARYNLSWSDKTEMQSSSGVIISTGFGSTGWLQSILAGAHGVVGGRSEAEINGFGWDKQRLQFAVREPFPSNTTGTELVFGQVQGAEKLTLESFMPENGVVFSDGIQGDYLAFNSGCIVTVGVSGTVGRLVV